MSDPETTVPTVTQPAPVPQSGGKGADAKSPTPKEIGGPKGLEPTRYGDWEKNGRCIDF